MGSLGASPPLFFGLDVARAWLERLSLAAFVKGGLAGAVAASMWKKRQIF